MYGYVRCRMNALNYFTLHIRVHKSRTHVVLIYVGRTMVIYVAIEMHSQNQGNSSLFFFFFVSLLASYKLQISYIRMLSWVYNCVCVRERLDAVELINVRSIIIFIIHFAAQNLTYYNQTRDCFVIYCNQVSHTPHNAHFMLSANSIPAFVVFRGAA